MAQKIRLIHILSFLAVSLIVEICWAQEKEGKKGEQKKEVKFVWPSPLDPGKYDPLYRELPFGQPKEHFLVVLHSRLAAQLKPLLKATLDPRERDRLRLQMEKTFEEIKESYTEFVGQDTGYSVSVVAGEFAHNAGEAVFKYRYGGNTAYFFLSGGKLWKLFLCIESNKSFDEQLIDLISKYGEPTEMEYADLEKQIPKHAVWKDSTFILDVRPPADFFTCTRLKWTFVPMIDEVKKRRAEQVKAPGSEEIEAEELLKQATQETNEDLDDVVDQIIKQREKGKR